MINLHDAIRVLNPSVVTIRGEDAFDKDGNEVAYDKAFAENKLAEMQAEEEAKQTESLNKLAALGLTTEDLQRILGK